VLWVHPKILGSGTWYAILNLLSSTSLESLFPKEVQIYKFIWLVYDNSGEFWKAQQKIFFSFAIPFASVLPSAGKGGFTNRRLDW
jgi:hypothetical protein